MKNAIKGFQGQYRFLSNFWPAEVVLDGIKYPSVEHAYQAAKTYPEERAPFETGTPGGAKRLGKIVRMIPGFEFKKISIMHNLVRAKFLNHKDLGDMLLATGNSYLEETNEWKDTFWGVCRGEGSNFLGFILMMVRYELKLRRKA